MCDFTVGCAVFREAMPVLESRRLFTSEVLSIIEREDQWWLCFGIYRQNWSAIFALMREARVLKLELGRNEHSRMIEEVKGVAFPLLRALCFGKNRIASLEGIQHINAPCLEWLSFEENYISDLRSLRKASFRHLKVLNLKTNRIREVDLRAVHAPALQKVTIEAYFEREAGRVAAVGVGPPDAVPGDLALPQREADCERAPAASSAQEVQRAQREALRPSQRTGGGRQRERSRMMNTYLFSRSCHLIAPKLNYHLSYHISAMILLLIPLFLAFHPFQNLSWLAWDSYVRAVWRGEKGGQAVYGLLPWAIEKEEYIQSRIHYNASNTHRNINNRHKITLTLLWLSPRSPILKSIKLGARVRIINYCKYLYLSFDVKVGKGIFIFLRNSRAADQFL